MAKFIAGRLLQGLPLLVLVTMLVFFLIKLAGDPFAYLALDPSITEADRARLRRTLGLDDPVMLQYLHWMIGDNWYRRDLDFDDVPETYGDRLGLLRGDFGVSIRYRKPVTEVIAQFLPNTLILFLSAFSATLIVGIGVGVYSALHQYSLADHLATSIAFVTYSVPLFIFALLAVLVFAVLPDRLGLPHLPTSGMYNPRGDKDLVDLLLHLILPTLTLASVGAASYARFVRASMLTEIHSDYGRTATAKGLHPRRVTYVHIFRNAMIPLVSIVSIDIAFFFSGAVVTETIFAWPGMGRLFIQSLESIDPPIIMIFTVLTAVSVVVFQIAADIVYAWVDPRIRIQ